MGGGAVPIVEQGLKDTLIQGAKALEFHSGDAPLRSLGDWGVQRNMPV